MEKKFSVPRGTSDILPDQVSAWQELENTARRVLDLYGYQEIRTPIFEETALFARSLGTTSDVVQKQMLTLAKNQSPQDKEDEGISNLALRPEGTASIVRSYIENSIDRKESLSKLYYLGPMFRGERPQKGRLRQFHQIGVEAIGPDSALPYLDAEVIALSMHLLSEFGLKGFKLKINSLGSPEDKKQLAVILRERLKKDFEKLCADCQARFERNVFRILDCKNRQCQAIVAKLDLGQAHLSPESQEYFEQVQQALKMLKVPFEVSPNLVRGLDYYTHTVFEISHEGLGSQDALGAGGRYNSLVKDLGGDPKGTIGAIGFALGIERIFLARPQDAAAPASTFLDAFVVHLDDEGEKKAYQEAYRLVDQLRRQGLSAQMNYAAASIKSQMRLADKLGSRYVIILGEDELRENSAMLKNMGDGKQTKVPLKDIVKSIPARE